MQRHLLQAPASVNTRNTPKHQMESHIKWDFLGCFVCPYLIIRGWLRKTWLALQATCIWYVLHIYDDVISSDVASICSPFYMPFWTLAHFWFLNSQCAAGCTSVKSCSKNYTEEFFAIPRCVFLSITIAKQSIKKDQSCKGKEWGCELFDQWSCKWCNCVLVRTVMWIIKRSTRGQHVAS